MIIDATIRTISCDGPECKRSIIFDRTQEKAVFDTPENSWLKTTRVVQTADNRNLLYCSDVCTVKGVATGVLNIPEAPKVIPAGNAAAIAQAAHSAAAARAADEAIRNGGKAKVQ